VGEIRPLTSLRGLAALSVVAYHVSVRPGGAWLENPIVHHGYLAVDFFLLLSGFVLAGAYGETATTWQGYLQFVRRRFFRLFPLHLVVLAVIVLVDSVWSLAKVLLEGALMHRWYLFPAIETLGPRTPTRRDDQRARLVDQLRVGCQLGLPVVRLSGTARQRATGDVRVSRRPNRARRRLPAAP